MTRVSWPGEHFYRYMGSPSKLAPSTYTYRLGNSATKVKQWRCLEKLGLEIGLWKTPERNVLKNLYKRKRCVWMTELIGFFSWNCTQCEFFNFSSNLLLKKSYFSVKLLHHSLLYFLRESIYLIIFYLLSSFWQFLREIVYYGSPFFLVDSLSKIVNSTLTYNLVTSNSLTMQLRF